MSATPYFKLYFSDLAGDTLALSDAEMGSYLLLLGAMWNAGGSLPATPSDLARIARVTPAKWAKRWNRLRRFFVEDGDEITHNRLKNEREKATGTSRKRSESGKAGAEAKARKNKGSGQAIASANPKQTSSIPKTIAKRKKDADASSAASAAPKTAKAKLKADPWAKDAHFSVAWADCTDQMRRRSSRAKAWAKWRANPAGGEAKLLALRAYLKRDPDVQRTGGPGLHIWLADKLAEWLAEPGETAIVAAAWDGPPDVRQAVERGFNDPAKAASYLRSCVFDEADRVLHSPNGFVADEIRKAAGGELSAIGVKVQVRKARAA